MDGSGWNVDDFGRADVLKKPPGCIYKFLCPPCAVHGHEGVTCNLCLSLILCGWFTVCCWTPKNVP